MTPITIRGHTYASTAAAASGLGVAPSTISVAKTRGTLGTVGLSDRRYGRGRVNVDKYDPQADAEYILESILDRRHWTPDARDRLQYHLETVTRKGVK